MKVYFYGAAREVTGSRHLVEVNGKRILLDCGMFQGRRKDEFDKNSNFLFDPKTVDAVILSHAHIDHSGNLPRLTKLGFEGSIYSTSATRDLCSYMLADSAFIQEREFEYLTKKKKKKDIAEPIYNSEDVEKTMEKFVTMEYEKEHEIFPGVTLLLRDAGHILGSSTITLKIADQSDGGKLKTLVFTGDLGRKGLPLLHDPTAITEADYLISESTYGNRFHKNVADIEGSLRKVVVDTAAKGGKIIIPAFAVERTQEIVYYLNILFQKKLIPEIPIFVDSPLAVNVTDIFKNHPECLDKATWDEFLHNQKNPFGFGRLRYITEVEDSKALSGHNGPAIIISAAGMAEHGRILHHLKNNVEDPKNTILIVGYMAENTLGRKIFDREKVVNIFGEPYHLRANVVVMDAFSAHADRSDLLDFIAHIKGLKKIFLVHGEETQGLTFCDILNEEGYKDVCVPKLGESYDI
ncbi:MAG: MBL fold metallo-hydrolase [Patescibacteria group bacterium]